MTIYDRILPREWLRASVSGMYSPAILFDLDGTLVDTAPDLLGALNSVLLRAGRTRVDPQNLRHMVGHGARALIDQAMAATGEPVRAEHLPPLVEQFIEHYRQHIVEGSRPFPYVGETLRELVRQGARLAVLTNKPQVLAQPILEELGLASFFRVICGSGYYDFTKPDPRVVAHVVEKLGGRGNGVVIVGDSAVDVATARAANIPVLLLSYGYTPEPACTLGADGVLDCFSEVPAAVENLLLVASAPAIAYPD